MNGWPKYPMIYEINTWVWLAELGGEAQSPLTLAAVPETVWDGIADLGFDAVWLMGVWERSPAGIRITNANPGLQEDFRRALPDFTEEDNVGSPYCVRRYVVDAHLGGPEALAVARRKLAERGMRLILDFVPNHVAPDHPWVTEHPEYFIPANEEERRSVGTCLEVAGCSFACGRDPHFLPWPDVLQLNAFEPALRIAATETLASIADQCDGVRCDMAMLLMNPIFEQTWGDRAGTSPVEDYWLEIIPAIKAGHPDFKFIAEAYWELEWELQQQGFDYCYDKRLYDRVKHDGAESVRFHLSAELAYQEKLVRFLENHDEPRAAATFSGPRHRAAAVVTATLPGARLFHEGQLEGRWVRVPIFLARRPAEPVDSEVKGFYKDLLRGLRTGEFFQGRWKLCERSGWPDNASYLNLIAWCWQQDEARCLIVVNLSDMQSQGLVCVPWTDLADHEWLLRDLITGVEYRRNGSQMLKTGLYVDLEPWGYHFFHCE